MDELEDAAFTIKDVMEDFEHNKRINRLLFNSYNFLIEAINSIKNNK